MSLLHDFDDAAPCLCTVSTRAAIGSKVLPCWDLWPKLYQVLIISSLHFGHQYVLDAALDLCAKKGPGMLRSIGFPILAHTQRGSNPNISRNRNFTNLITSGLQHDQEPPAATSVGTT